jgi:hypothetical protein
MSEYRKTTTIEEVTLPEPVPVVSMAELVSRIDWNVGRTNLGVPGIGLDAHLESIAVTFHAMGLEETSLSLEALLESTVLTIPKSEERAVGRRIRDLLDGGDVAGLLDYGRELAVARQERLMESSLEILRQSCLRSGFDQVRIHPKEGILVALESGTTHRAVIEIEKAARGQVGVNFDLDGFRGGVCVDRTNAIAAHASELGFKLDTRSRRRKADSPVADRRNLPNRTQQGNG